MSTLALVLSLALQASPPAKPLPKPAAQAEKKAPAEDVAAATQAWQAERLQRLTSPDGWLTLVGLTWLKEGEQTAGSAPGSAVPLPAPVPPKAGTFVRKGDSVSFQPAPGVAFTLEGKPFTGGELKTDEKGEPDVLRLGGVSFQIIRRKDRLGVRVKDSEAATRKQFQDRKSVV